MIIDEIETMHDIARGVSVAIPAAEYGNEMLHDVIERIACQLDSEKSIWQKIADERYPAWEWVETHGGIDAVKRRLMPEGVEWPRFEDGEPVHIGDVASDVKVRSVVLREDGIILSDCTSVPGWGTWRSYNGPIKRHAPKVLDADGVEIRVGDTVWWTRNYAGMFHVESITMSGKCAIRDDDPDEPCGMTVPPDQLTHRAPVLAADGEPLREGDTVWVTRDNPYGAALLKGDEVTVRFVPQATVHVEDKEGAVWHVDSNDLTHERPAIGADGELVKSGDTVWCIATDEQLGDMKVNPESFAVYRDELTVYCVYIYDGELWASLMETIRDVKVHYLTHERPDSWERIEADCMQDAKDYCEERGIEPEYPKHIGKAKCEDLVRRAKALAERERGE